MLNMEKIDLKKELKAFYNPTAKEVTLIDVPKMNFIMIDGRGAPESPQFAQSIEALYPIAYGIKFDKKKTDGTDYGVMPLEGLFWADDMKVFMPETVDRNKWQWTLMIMQPDFIIRKDFENAVATAKKKKDNPSLIKSALKVSPKVNQHKLCTSGRIRQKGRIFKSCIIKLPESAVSYPANTMKSIYLTRAGPRRIK